jgi:hypothetical protein
LLPICIPPASPGPAEDVLIDEKSVI